MNTANLKSVAFWADLVLTVLSLVLATGLVTSVHWLQILGWVSGLLTTLGYHAFDIGVKKEVSSTTEAQK